MFVKFGETAEDKFEWSLRTAEIKSADGRIIFKQENVEFPVTWSDTAVNIVTQKYFHGQQGTDERETSLKQLVGRVVNTICDEGYELGYFETREDRDIFRKNLSYVIYDQRLAFNSPVWFNVGLRPNAQSSACFINSVEDSMDSILELCKTEGSLFKYGSGTGTNLSPLRSSREKITGGGIASGPVSFMKGYDTFAGAIKSGGKTRRSAKMVILDVDHGDIRQFIDCKVKEEKKIQALLAAGYSAAFNDPEGAYENVNYQNANHSVRVSDNFMEAILREETFDLMARDGSVLETVDATELMDSIAEAAWKCGDPGIQFSDTINNWNPVSDIEPINASNPCSEYMFVDDSACNLASINLVKYLNEDLSFNVPEFSETVRLSITAQEILVQISGYPTEKIAKNSDDYRPLGLGYANLGAYLMLSGVPYNSLSGQKIAANITSLMCAQAYLTSTQLAKRMGPFRRLEECRDSFRNVLQNHARAAEMYDFPSASVTWTKVLEEYEKYGVRNGQVTVLAPTGTIAFMMDCATTGIEPEISHVKYKHTADGGLISSFSTITDQALRNLGYTDGEIEHIAEGLKEGKGMGRVKDVHASIFDTSLPPFPGGRAIHHDGHIGMMAACQPFLSGAISKTINMPNDSTVEDVKNVYINSWSLGLKSVAIYRDGCKQSQPLVTSLEEKKEEIQTPPVAVELPRKKLNTTREAMVHKFSVGGHEGYLTIGLYDDGRPGEIFINMSKQGSTIQGMMDAFGVACSLAIQHGCPIEKLCEKFSGTSFEPSGFTGYKNYPIATSILDYVFNFLYAGFAGREKSDQDLDNQVTSSYTGEGPQARITPVDKGPKLCGVCGNIMKQNGTCHVCPVCGNTSGCS